LPRNIGKPRSLDKQYSRSLGLNQGIELLALNVSRPAPVLSIMHAGANSVLSWQGARTDFRLQTATNPAASATWSYVSTQPTPVQECGYQHDFRCCPLLSAEQVS